MLRDSKSIFIVAAGNNSEDLDKCKINDCYYPASFSLNNIHVVGNLNENGKRNETSNYGSHVHYWEMGTKVISTIPDNKYYKMTGTSMATAIHTGKFIYEMSH